MKRKRVWEEVVRQCEIHRWEEERKNEEKKERQRERDIKSLTEGGKFTSKLRRRYGTSGGFGGPSLPFLALHPCLYHMLPSALVPSLKLSMMSPSCPHHGIMHFVVHQCCQTGLMSFAPSYLYGSSHAVRYSQRDALHGVV